ncbi:MARTX multifunctional-autoprocessing repeats-in-toxin holotoxin RtxA [Xenorhabdus sp. IM139775]|uniref:MARTX multifunctional-autoprocessing repeats-in-toxin holotoxin RtxA n=1 Tax=Xenorhabdus sp. IM139775 TaxID=3025876 RepID=UPI002359D7F4|nr:MARTX multifunctional-autoprocessing repeats-in-toxin holotoxin RtxA [Xenorhabdus sp. IM139775]MDC9593659.1 MARTX multifunctional-autoprocessing repeats-in-toxin holotoxin RtxA [Xenorhabdus sp. IM139775]
MGKSVGRSLAYTFTGVYEDDDEGNNITAIGFGGVINAYGGNDHIVVGSLAAQVNTTWGHDTIVGGAGYLDIHDTGGNLTVKGGSGYTSITKTHSGPITYEGVAGAVKINHTGDKSGIFYSGAAGYNSITRKGLQGDISFKGAGAYNEIWHETNQGNLSFAGAGAGNKIDRTWLNQYQGSQGNVTFGGAGAANVISSRVETGNIHFSGAGAYNFIVRKGKAGDITLGGAGAYNRVERTRQANDVYAETKGDIRFNGVGGYNSLYSDVAHGHIHFTGAGGYNEITRKGAGNDFGSEGIEYANAEEVVLTSATLSGEWIGAFHQVIGVKSAREPNTYLFAFEDGTHTKINKVKLSNDPETGKLRYYSTAWYKEGKHLKGLDKQDISAAGHFNSVGADGAYRLSNLTVEQRKAVSIDAIEQKLTENQWVNYGGGVLINAADITLSDAKMGGYAFDENERTADVTAVKSNRMPNTYVYSKAFGRYKKVVVVELRNDPKTGVLQYFARPCYKFSERSPDFANETFSTGNGYKPMGVGSYSLSDLHYRVNTERTIAARVSGMHEYQDLELFKSATDSGESSGDIHYTGAGGANVIKSNVTRGNVYFNGAGIANVILHQAQQGDMDVNAGGAANVLVRVGDGRYLAHLLAVGNISIHKGNGNSRIAMGGGFNTHTQMGHGDAFWFGIGGANVLTQKGNGNVSSILVGGTNVLTKVGEGDLASAMLGGANVITHVSNDQATSGTKAIALGGANVLTKKGKGHVQAVMGGGANVLTHIGDGNTTGMMLGGANILTKVGNGDTTGIMFGLGNILTHVGNGQTLGVMAGAGNLFTKVQDGTAIAAMIGAGNIFTHVGKGNDWALMGGAGNIFTKVGDGDALALMLALGNVFTHVGDGMSVALMIAKGNIATKVGDGDALSAMIGKGNIFTQIGHGSTFAAMIGGANVLTKVGTGLTVALMVGKANIYTHVIRDNKASTSIGLFAGTANVMTKVGNGTTLAAMFGKANIMTHVGNGLTGVLALGKANIVTKVGDDLLGVVAVSEANVVTHVGDGTTAAVLAGKGNILTKVGKGPTVGLLISEIGNIMTHVGDGTTVGFAKGDANIITKVGDGLGINAAWGKANVLTHAGDGDRYNFAKGDANIITKVGNGQEVTVVQGQANIVTHVGNGDDYTGAWGKANVITKVGDGRNVVLAKGDANIVTQIGDGDSFNALWSQGNVVTKVGDGMQVTAAKGKGNITTTVGDGLSVTAAHGDLNINTKVGDGVSVNVAWGKLNVNTKVGDGLNVSVMKGEGNANIHVGDGLNIHASYARNNVAIQVGNGDFYSLAVAKSNTQSDKLGTLFSNIKQTLLGVAGSQGINYLVNGDEASTSGTHKGRGAIDLPAVSSLNGFKLTEMGDVTSDLKNSLKGVVTGVDAPDIDSIQNKLGDEARLNPNQSRNLIINGDFEQGAEGWQHTNGIEASHSAKAYGLSAEGHGERVSELDVQGNTHIYQDIQDLTAGEDIVVKFDFARRVGSSADNGLEVWWNGEVVFAAANGKAEWQNKALTLTAKAGSNRLAFSGIGLNDGFGYVLDNVVAMSELSGSGIADHVKQDQAAQNALQDKERAEAGRLRLEQERDNQLNAISGTQAQLESTDLAVLNANGQTQRNAIQGESQAVADELQANVKGLEALNSHAIYHGKSGKQHRDQFARGLLGHVQTDLDKANETARNQLDHAQKAAAGHLGDIKEAVAKSETGALNAEQNRQHAEQDAGDAHLQAENRRKEALSYEQRAYQAGRDGESAAQKAEQRGQHEASAADSKTTQVQNDAKGAKLADNYKPKRAGATGSGLSGSAYESHYSEYIEKAEQSKSHINPESTVQADGEFSEELQGLDNNLNGLGDAKAALSRLQINRGIRVKKSVLTSEHTEMSVNPPVSQPTDAVTEWVRNTPPISGLDLSGLQALGEELIQQEAVSGSETESTAAIRAQKVAEVYRWLDRDNDLATEKYIPVPGFDRVDADIPDDVRQKMVASIEGYLEFCGEKVPKDQFTSLAKLFVDATIDYDWDKRVELVSRLESYGYSFEPVHGDKSIVSFWSGKNFKGYRKVLDAVQTDGKKVVYDIDVQGNDFALKLNKQLQHWSNMLDILNPDIPEQERQALQSVISASTRSNTGFWSSLYATGSRDDVYVIAEGGLRLGNYFWNVELPVLRQLQREGLVGEIRLLDKPAEAYQGMSPESIGRRLTAAGVSVKARFDSLSFAEQEKLLAQNPDKYQPDTLVYLDIKTSAIDNLLNQALPFYGLRTERNLLVRESDDDDGFEVRPWPGNQRDEFKTIRVEDPEDSTQIKAVERFILANYDNYDQLPEALYLAEDRMVSHEQGRTRIIAEKVEGSWNYQPNTDLMSAHELQEAAYVKGKIRGDSYRHVLDALKDYESTLQNSPDYGLEAVEKLTHLRQQAEGYLLGHPDSARIPALNKLLSQLKVRMEESLVLAEPTLESTGKGSFSDLYNKLGNANLKDSKHLYLDEQGDFVTRGKANIQIAMKAQRAENAVEQIKAAVSREYGQPIADAVFANVQARSLAKDGKGIDVSGLKKIYQAIEQQLSPVSATLFVWQPSDHSRLGHAALQIGQGRIQVSAEDAGEFNKKNYVSWWPKGSKSPDIRRILNVSSEQYPDLRLRWRDLSQPAGQNTLLELDVASEEGDKFGMQDGDYKLAKFNEKLEAAKGVDAKFADFSEHLGITMLENPKFLQSSGIPEYISRPFVQQVEAGGVDVFELGKEFAEVLRTAAKQQYSAEVTEKRITHVIRQFAERELSDTQDFKSSEADQGRVFRINLAGLDTAAMQAEWHKISQNPDARYQLLTDNCSSIVARVLKAGGADNVIGHTWRPKWGIWTPTELFNYAQTLQEAQIETYLHKPNQLAGEELEALGHSDKKDQALEKVAIDNDGTPPRDKEPLNPVARFLNGELYGAREDRRNVNSGTQGRLDEAVTKGTANKVTLQGDAGRLTGYYHNGDQKDQSGDSPAKKVVLFIHGSGSSAEEQASVIQSHYQEQGVDMLAVNLRGYGTSDGHPNEKGLYQDARTMFRYLVNDRGIKPENIIIHGYSMGGPIAADLARYAEHNGQAVSGLLLDRPMPSMTKAITAHEVPDPAGLTGALAKSVNGRFSVEKNLQGISKQTPIMLLTDGEGLGDAGEKLRAKLAEAGYQVSGEQTFYGHEDSNLLMSQYADKIVSTLSVSDPVSNPQHENGRVKTGLVEKALYTLFDAKSGGKELDQYSFHFTQGGSLLNHLEKLVPEVGNVLLTKGNHVESKEFLEGICFALSGRYLMEERVHGLGGGKAYLSWLTDAVKAYNDNAVNKKSDINSVEAALLNQYRRQNIGSAIQDLLSMQYSRTQNMNWADREKANQAYGGKLKANGLTGNRIDRSLSNDVAGYESVMEQLQHADKTTYMSFMSEDHAMAVTVHKGENQTVWSFYDPNFGIKSFDNYQDFKGLMDSFHKGIVTGHKSIFGYKYLASQEKDQSFYVNYNTFEDGSVTQYDGVWKQARDGEQPYVLRALKEQGKTFKLGSNITGRVVDYRDDAVTLEVTAKKVGKVLVEVESHNFKQAAHLVQSNIDKVFANPAASKLTLKVSGDINITDEVKVPLKGDVAKDNAADGVNRVVNNHDVGSWERAEVKPQSDGENASRFTGQIIIQTENDPVAAKAAASLAGKHPDASVIVQLDADGKYRVVYGDPATLSGQLQSGQLQSGKLRWQIVGHGREESVQNHTRISGYSADELALRLKQFRTDFKHTGTPDHISLVGCSLISDDKREGFARRFISALDKQGMRTTVSARSSDVAVDSIGRKYTKDAREQWVHKLTDNKIVLGWNEAGAVEGHAERVRRGISENDIVLSRVGQTDAKAQGAIAENTQTFHAPKQRDAVDNHAAAASSNNQLSYSGNIQVQAGDGEFTVINWGTSNVGIKVGQGGFKSLAFGDNNVMVHIGDGDSKHSVDIAGYRALEGAQLFMGNRNVSFNLGHSNDLIVMLDKSIPTPPLVNPFDGAARISGVLQEIGGSFNSPDWLAKQDQQWTLEGAKKYVSDLSGLDLTSSVDYKTLTDLDSQNERSSRGLKSDLESTLNKKYSEWLGGKGNIPGMGKVSRADKFRQANEKLAFNFAVGGQGADIQVTTGNWNFMFGDNIQSILDTNLGSLFGLMTQNYSSTGVAKNTFTFTPTDVPRQIVNKLKGNLAGVSADTTLADIFGVGYTPQGGIVSHSGQPVDGVAILREMLEIIGEFSGDQLQAFTDPEKLLSNLESGLNIGADGVKSFAESHGLKAKAPDESQEGQIILDKGAQSAPQTDRPFGLASLNMPNLFVTLFDKDKQAELGSQVTNLKENLTADLLNIQEKTFGFLHNSGYLKEDGDMNVSLGNYNFNWGGDGKDLGAYLGDNNNFWGGRGDDTFYSVGTSNIFTGGEGHDMGVLMGRENMMFGGAGNDVAVLAGRINYAYLGDGDDQAYVFGEGGVISGGKGRDYIVASGNFNRIHAGDDQDYVVTIGNNNQVELGQGNDFAAVFGNDNQIDGSAGNNSIKLMGYHSVINGGTGNDHLIADVVAKFSQLNGGDGDDLLILGGYQNRFKGGTGVNSFVVSGDVIDNVVEDIKQGDKIIFNDINWQNLWFQRSGYDLVLLTHRNIKDTSAQGQFEAVGSVTFNNYFDGNRAAIITQMGDKEVQGEREYTALSANAVDSLVQAMSGFAPKMGDSGFIDSLDSQTKSTIVTAWSDTTNGKSKLV